MKLNNNKLFIENSYINGEWINTEKKFTVTNPFNNSTIANVSDLDLDHIKQSIETSEKAFKNWKKTLASERSNILRNWYNLILENKEDLAKILTIEQGKPYNEALGEIIYGASFIEWFSEEAKRIYGDTIPTIDNNKRLTVIKQPIGVCVAITPWNFPNAMITRKAGSALATGCTMVLKPAKYTPLSALALAYLGAKAGIPKGVFNVITTSNSSIVGNEFSSNPIIKKLSFTGSTEIGKILAEKCSKTVKKVSLELGGNAPFIVFEDADIDSAVEGAIIAKYRNAGQTCVCTNRIYVHEKIYDKFVEKFSIAVNNQSVGNGLNNNTNIGPIIDNNSLEFINELVEDAISKGAKVETGGKKHKLGGNFYSPTVLSNVNSKMRVTHEEIFGPVAPVYKFSSEEEVIKMANDTEYGLASYFYSRDIGKIWRVAEELEYGMVGINTGIISTTVAPFGGIKHSGYGREGSKYGMDDYLEIKYLCFSDINK